MARILEGAEWIWCNDSPQADEYGEFADCFPYEAGRAVLRISADSNYAAYVNGELAAWGQYADFPWDKVYDEVDVSGFCRKGENRLAIVVWYYGISTSSTYCRGNAGLLYELAGEKGVLCRSGQETLSRMSRAYLNHRMHIITGQLGLGYGYDATRDDGWMTGELSGFGPSAVVEQELPLRARPCDKLTFLPDVDGVECKRLDETTVVYDLGSEQVGFLCLKLDSPCAQDITIAYGEHIEDGRVRRIIGGRDFSVFYRAKEGRNVYRNPFRRLGCRYLEIHSEQPVTVEQLGIAPTMYVLAERERPRLDALQEKIYDMCVETLHLCMHEHYEDCPWREQALYAMDSRNQMLCGYYAFGEYRFPRASLELMSKDRREDGLLSICYPIEMDFVIPAFSLHYITECREYLEYSGDREFLREIYPKLVSVVEAFTGRMEEGHSMEERRSMEKVHSAEEEHPMEEVHSREDGLVLPFAGRERYWNFYEWREGLDGYATDPSVPDVLLNSLLSLALQHLADIGEKLGMEEGHSAEEEHAMEGEGATEGKRTMPEVRPAERKESAPADYRARAQRLNQRIYEAFWDEEAGLCHNLATGGGASQLGNALAILCGAVEGERALSLCERLRTDKTMTEVSLSMLCFKYDAWLKVDRERYAPVILEDIRRIYAPMVEYGGNTVWETEAGASDFDNAGSLCHGWSAMPVYYYHILLGQADSPGQSDKATE